MWTAGAKFVLDRFHAVTCNEMVGGTEQDCEAAMNISYQPQAASRQIGRRPGSEIANHDCSLPVSEERSVGVQDGHHQVGILLRRIRVDAQLENWGESLKEAAQPWT